ncbi:MAG TPA: hypothetical protein VFC78_14370, partial [Tepidisphaeraceae bacterium]|nr:hypothetical protein [Tepidisphaeraceae bacterium]
MQVDPRGRNVEVTDANGNKAYTIYDDVNHQTITFPGWNAATHTTTGPVVVSGEYWPASGAGAGQQTVYDQALTTSATPTWDSTTNAPTGIGALSSANIQSLSRQLTNNGGQVIESDAYFSMAGISYSAAYAQLGASSNDSSTGNYHATLMHYDDRGREDMVTAPTGTITYSGHDGLGRVYT